MHRNDPRKVVPKRKKTTTKNKSDQSTIVKIKKEGKTVVRITDRDGSVTELNSSLLTDKPKSIQAIIREVSLMGDDKTQQVNMYAVILKAFE